MPPQQLPELSGSSKQQIWQEKGRKDCNSGAGAPRNSGAHLPVPGRTIDSFTHGGKLSVLQVLSRNRESCMGTNARVFVILSTNTLLLVDPWLVIQMVHLHCRALVKAPSYFYFDTSQLGNLPSV
jgi:hypothetical protein